MEVRRDLEIRARLAEYLAGQISLDQFQQWFVPATWDIESAGDSAASDVAHEVQLRLAEFSDDHWTEQELHRRLSPLIQSYSVSISFGSQVETVHFNSTASETHYQQISGREFSVEFV